MKQKNKLFLLPAVVGLSIFYLIPFVISFKYIFGIGVARFNFAGLYNFRDLLSNSAFSLAVKNTAIFSCVAVPLLVFSALVLSLRFSESRLLEKTILLPMITPVASALLGWSTLFSEGGIIGRLLSTQTDFLDDPYARWVIIFIFIIKNLGYMTIIFSGAINGIPKEIHEAFMLETPSRLKYLRHIVIPMIYPVIFFVVIFSLVNSFQMFREIYSLYGSMPPSGLYMLQSFMNNNFLKLNYNRLCTASFIVTMVIALMSSVYLYFQARDQRR